MPRSYIVDAAQVPWKRSVSEGVSFECQVLLSGDDGGPEALRFRFDDCPSVYAHMHLTSQFQLLLSGTMDFPRGVKHLEALAVHYTDHNVPYGPFAVGDRHEMLVLHPKAGGIIAMTNLDARRKINLRGRLFAALAADAQWQPIPGAEHTVYRRLMPVGYGPDAIIVKAPPDGALAMPAAPHGRYEVVLEGSAYFGEQCLESPGFRYVQSDDPAAAVVTGESGATIAFLTFDQDAQEGGLTGEGLAVEAAQMMARAI